MSAMTWEERLHAMQTLEGSYAPSLLKLLEPGSWRCSVPGEIGGDGMLTIPCCLGCSPEAAVNAAWAACTELPTDRYVVVRPAFGEVRLHFRWSGFMWVEQPSQTVNPNAVWHGQRPPSEQRCVCGHTGADHVPCSGRIECAHCHCCAFRSVLEQHPEEPKT